MSATSPNKYLVLLVAAFCAMCSCGKRGNAQQGAVAPMVEQETDVGAKLERINVAEIGKLRSRVGKEVIVYGKVSGTSTSRSGHQFLNFSSGFKVVCLKGDVAQFSKAGPAELYAGRLIEVRGEVATHKGKPQVGITSPGQVKVIDLGRGGAAGMTAGKEFEMLEVGLDTWVTPAGLRYTGRDAQGLSRKDHVLRHSKDQPDRAGSHGVFDAGGDKVFEVIDEAWRNIKERNLRPRMEGDSQTYTVPMGRRIGYLGGKNGARKKNPALDAIFIVVRKGTAQVITAFPR